MVKLTARLNVLIVFIVILVFSYKFAVFQEIPIPSDTIAGLYHPFIDHYKNLTGGMKAFKNFLITDPVRQTYVWKKLTIDSLKNGELPLWNLYSFSGTPLLANWQAGVFYPLNILFFILPFNWAWGVYIISQLWLIGGFTYLYLRQHKLSPPAGLVGGLSFTFSGFMIAWLEWGNIGHTVVWLLLGLYFIDCFFHTKKSKNAVFLFITLFISFLAGHLQTFAYVFLITFLYFVFRWLRQPKKNKPSLRLVVWPLIFWLLFITPFIVIIGKYIFFSARSADIVNSLSRPDWFLPPPHLLQFLAPDFFGHPSTLNYWGVWNYGEFVGYIGTIPLFLALLAVFFILRQPKSGLVRFWFILVLFGLLMALKNPVSKLPYLLNISLWETIQPSRWILLTVVGLSMLAAYGWDFLQKKVTKKILGVSVLFLAAYIILFIFAYLNRNGFLAIIKIEEAAVAWRNLILSMAIAMVLAVVLFFVYWRQSRLKKSNYVINLVLALFLIVMVFDWLRFGWKFTPFNAADTIFPDTQITRYLQQDNEIFRIMSTDRRIMAPNFSAAYNLQDVAGYDPLYLKSYADFVQANESNSSHLEPFSFNRIITPQNIASPLFPLFNVKYLLALDDRAGPGLTKVGQEGETRLYENAYHLPRAFFVYDVYSSSDEKQILTQLFDPDFDIRTQAIVYELKSPSAIKSWWRGEYEPDDQVEIINYQPNQITVHTRTKAGAFLVFLDVYYPDWKVFIDNQPSPMWQTNYTWRGVRVPAGEHTLDFKINIW